MKDELLLLGTLGLLSVAFGGEHERYGKYLNRATLQECKENNNTLKCRTICTTKAVDVDLLERKELNGKVRSLLPEFFTYVRKNLPTIMMKIAILETEFNPRIVSPVGKSYDIGMFQVNSEIAKKWGERGLIRFRDCGLDIIANYPKNVVLATAILLENAKVLYWNYRSWVKPKDFASLIAAYRCPVYTAPAFKERRDTLKCLAEMSYNKHIGLVCKGKIPTKVKECINRVRRHYQKLYGKEIKCSRMR